MLCPFCSAENKHRGRHCQTCQALLPRIPDLGLDRLGPTYRDDVVYPEPSHHYETAQILGLHELVERVLDGEDLFQELDAHLSMMAENFSSFVAQHVGQMEVLLQEESARLPNDDYNLQLAYILKRGVELFEQGCQAFDVFFETESEEPEELEAAYCLVRDGNDYFCLALELAAARYKALQALLAARAVQELEGPPLDFEDWEPVPEEEEG